MPQENLTNVLDDYQVGQLDRLSGDDTPVAAVMTMGGNDIGFEQIIVECVRGHINVDLLPWGQLTSTGLVTPIPSWDRRCSDDPTYTDRNSWLIRDNVRPMSHIYALAYDAMNRPDDLDARQGNVAPLFILAYPQLFPDGPSAALCLRADILQGVKGFDGGYDSQEIEYGNTLVRELNAALQDSAEIARSTGRQVYFVGGTEEAFLPDHTTCSRSDYYANPVGLLSGFQRGVLDALI